MYLFRKDDAMGDVWDGSWGLDGVETGIPFRVGASAGIWRILEQFNEPPPGGRVGCIGPSVGYIAVDSFCCRSTIG